MHSNIHLVRLHVVYQHLPSGWKKNYWANQNNVYRREIAWRLKNARHLSEKIEKIDSTLSFYYKASLETPQGFRHNELSRLYMLKRADELRLSQAEANLLAQICYAHAVPTSEFLELPKQISVEDENVRVLLIASLLRLADALDIDFYRLFWSKASCVIDSKRLEIAISVKTIQPNKVRSTIEREINFAINETNKVLRRYDLLEQFSLRFFYETIADPPLTANIMTAISNDIDLQDLMDTIEYNENKLKVTLTNRGRTLDSFSNMLLNFKRWNSTSPVHSSPSSLGGGYFLIWHHKGIVIDPGYDYVSTFIRSFSIEDINAVIVTHDHPDHCNDIPKILNLLHEVNKIKRQRRQRAHRIEFYVSLGVHQRYGEMLRSEPNALETRIVPGDPISLSRCRLDARSTRTQHPETNGLNTGFGIRLRSLPAGRLDIGVTSDTAYFSGLENEFDGVRILVAHIGRLRDPVTHSFSGNHLSFPGIVALVTLFSRVPELVVVSEFGEESKGDEYRETICQKLEQHLLNQGKNVRCIPADLNMCIELGRTLRVGRAEIGSLRPITHVRISEDRATGTIYYD